MVIGNTGDAFVPLIQEWRVSLLVDSVDGKITGAVLNTIMKRYPKSPSVSLTKMRIIKFKETIKKLSDPDISYEEKKNLALKAKEVQSAIKRLKENMTEEKFLIFYRYVVEGNTIRSLSFEYNTDTKTIGRMMNAAYKQLAIQLYPDIVILEMLTVGW